jgi:hypothetical protein
MSESLPAAAAASSTPLRRAPAMSLSSRDGLPEIWSAGSLFTSGTSCRPGLRCSSRPIMPGLCWRRRTISSNSRPAQSGYDARFAKKFGLLYAVGRLAVKRGVLPLPAAWPGIAVYRGYRNALLAAQGEAALTEKALARLISALKEPNRLAAIVVKLGSKPAHLNDRHVGVTLEHKGEQVIGVLDAALVQLAGDRQIARSLIKLLGTHGAYAGDRAMPGPPKLAGPCSSRARWSRSRDSGCSRQRRRPPWRRRRTVKSNVPSVGRNGPPPPALKLAAGPDAVVPSGPAASRLVGHNMVTRRYR